VDDWIELRRGRSEGEYSVVQPDESLNVKEEKNLCVLAVAQGKEFFIQKN